jgi:hypothetical protein
LVKKFALLINVWNLDHATDPFFTNIEYTIGENIGKNRDRIFCGTFQLITLDQLKTTPSLPNWTNLKPQSSIYTCGKTFEVSSGVCLKWQNSKYFWIIRRYYIRYFKPKSMGSVQELCNTNNTLLSISHSPFISNISTYFFI